MPLVALDPSWEEVPAAAAAPKRLEVLGSDWHEVTEEPAAEQPSMLEAGLRGLKQGVTFGFGDEIAGALESAFTAKTYQEARDEARAADKAAREAHGTAFTVGELGGGLATSLIPGGGLVKGAGFAANAVRGAGTAALSGIGESEGETIQEIAADAGKAGLVGATMGGVLGTLGEKLFRGAPGRADARLIQDITGGRATTAGKKIYQNEELVIETARKFGLEKVARDPDALLEAVQPIQQRVGRQIGDIYAEVDATFLGVKARDVVKALGAAKKQYSAPGEGSLRKQISRLQEEVREQWGRGSNSRVPLAKVNEMATKLEKIGFATTRLAPEAGTQLKRDTARAVNDVLKARMDEIAEFASHVKAAPTAGRSAPLAASMSAGDSLKRLKGLNADYRALARITEMTAEKAAVPTANRAAGGLGARLRDAVNIGSMAASLATGNPIPYLATKVGAPAAAAGARAGDELLRKLNIAAKAGQSTARLVQQALETGVPRAAIAAAINPATPEPEVTE